MQLRNKKCEINLLQIIKSSMHSDYVHYKSNKSKYDNANKLKIWIRHHHKIFRPS